MTNNVKVPIKNVTDVLEKFKGTREYEGVVATIQRWYYGSVVKASWCATSMSWALAQLGIMAYTIGKKDENVFNFHNKLAKTGTAKRLGKNDSFKRGDILIFLWSGTMSTTASKHITSVYADTPAGSTHIPCLGGNQGDMIKVSNFERSKIYSAWRPDYSKNRVHEL